MPTTKRRLNITLPKNTDKYLNVLAKNGGVSKSKIALDLIEEALETQEDMALGKLASERIRRGSRYISHEEMWKK